MTSHRQAVIALAALFIAANVLPAQGSLSWSIGGQAANPAQVSRDSVVKRGGRWSLRFSAAEDLGGFTTIAATFPATGYKGDSLRFTAYLRSLNLKAEGGVVWMRADEASRSVAFVTTQDRPLLGTSDWTPVSVAFAVPASATQISVGVFSMGAGTLWVDDVSIASAVATLSSGFEETDALSPQAATRPAAGNATSFRAPTRESPREGARAVSPRGIQNMTAFARAMGYVRFFHPADEAIRVNWDEFAVRGIRAVESARSANELATALQAQFASVAPTVSFTAGTAPARAPMPPAARVQFWIHRGVGSPSGSPVQQQQSIYSSRRVIVPLDAIGKPFMDGPPVPNPDRPFTASLEGGVTITMPLAIYTDRASLPESLATARPAWPDERLSPADRATRLADVALAWSVLQHFYPYFDIARTDWMATLRRSLAAAATDTDATTFHSTLRRLVADLRDGHGGVYPAPLNRVPDLRLDWVEGSIVVTAVGPTAASAGAAVGDVVTLVDGRLATDLLAERMQLASGATPQWIRTVALRSLLVGAPNTSVSIGLRGSAGVKTATLDRTSTNPEAVARPAMISEVAPGVMYVDLDRITDADFQAAIPRLQSAKGIVFDMRGYPRQVNTIRILAHLADTATASAHFEVPSTTMPDRAGVVFTDGAWRILPESPRFTARIAFLSGGGAISYAESTLGVVEAFHLGEIVGEPSAGTNGNVNTIQLPGNYSIAWTGMRVTKRDGTPHHGVGVKPTVAVSPTIAGIRSGRDEVLQRAIAVVSGRVVP